MKLSQLILLFITISFVIISCSRKPRNVLSEGQMVAVLQDLYLADAITKNMRDDYSSNQQKDALINGVLSKHGITQAELDSSLVWYADNIDTYSLIQDTVSSRLQKYSDQLSKLMENSYTYKLIGFTTELPEFYKIDSYTPTFRFNIDSTKLTSFSKDKFEFSFDIKGVDTVFHRIESSVYYKYKDSIVVDRRKIVADSHYVFNKPQLPDSLLREISGYVHMVMATDKMPQVLLNNIHNQMVKQTVVKDNIPETTDDELLNEMLSSKASPQ